LILRPTNQPTACQSSHLSLRQLGSFQGNLFKVSPLSANHPPVDWPAVAAAGNVDHHEYEF
jgi:hypothetical protein